MAAFVLFSLLSAHCVVSLPVCERGHGHADSGPVLLRDEPHGDGAGVGEGLAAGLRLPADGAGHQRPGRMGESSCLLSVYSLFKLFFFVTLVV